MPTKDLKPFLEFDRNTAGKRKGSMGRLDKVQFAPLEGQVAFLKDLIKFPEEAEKFVADPKGYSIEHGILLDPAVVQKILQQTLFDVALDEAFAEAAGPHVTKDLVDLRSRLGWGSGPDIDPVEERAAGPSLGRGGTVAAIPAAAAAGAAVVAAAAAVVTMVVTLVRVDRPSDLVELQGLGARGTLLPRGERFVDRTGIINLSRVPNIGRGGLIR